MHRIRGIFLGLSLLLACSAAAGQQIVNINAQVSGTLDSTTLINPVIVPMAPGNYIATPFDNSAAAGGFNAWNAWNGSVTGCDSGGANCATGWLTAYRIRPPGQPMLTAGGTVWATPALAVANGTSLAFTVASAGNVEFAVTDNILVDNLGGVSLRIVRAPSSTQAVPALGGTGLALLAVLLASGAALILRRT